MERETRSRWPGQAAVIVSVVHITKGAAVVAIDWTAALLTRSLRILFHAGGDEDPARLNVNDQRSFIGNVVLGMGFTFDDTDKKGVASPLALMDELCIRKSTQQRANLSLSSAGRRLNTSPTHSITDSSSILRIGLSRRETWVKCGLRQTIGSTRVCSERSCSN